MSRKGSVCRFTQKTIYDETESGIDWYGTQTMTQQDYNDLADYLTKRY